MHLRLVDSPPKGMAILTAMLLVLILTSLVAGLAGLAQASIARAQTARDIGQARYVMEGLRDYARWVLLTDARGGQGGSSLLDHLAEPWAQQIPRSRIDVLFGGQLSPEDRERFSLAVISGGIVDEQAKWNLQNLQLGGEAQESRLQGLRQLLGQTGLSPAESEALMAAVLERVPVVEGAGPAGSLASNAPWRQFQPLLEAILPGDEARQQLVRRWVTWLPEPSRLNINTASEEVMMATIPGMDRGQAESVVRYRARIPLSGESALISLLPSGVTVPAGQIGAQSSYFRLEGTVQFGAAELAFSSLLRRSVNQSVLLDHREL